MRCNNVFEVLPADLLTKLRRGSGVQFPDPHTGVVKRLSKYVNGRVLPQLDVFLELLLFPVWKSHKLRVRHLEDMLEVFRRQVLLW